MRSLLLLAVFATTAGARPLPMSYTTSTEEPGHAELEVFSDVVPLRALSPMTTEEESYLATAFQLELEVGLAERLDLGLYATLVPSTGDELAGTAQLPWLGTGLKQRLRYRLNPTADSVPIIGNAGVYVELAENAREIELEAKVLVDRSVGPWRVVANLSAEYEWYFSGQREWALNPSAGATYEVGDDAYVGLEAFMRAEYPTNPAPAMRTFGLGPHVYIGPTVALPLGKAEWAVGAYVRVTNASHDLEPGEPYGRFWLRSVIGFDL